MKGAGIVVPSIIVITSLGWGNLVLGLWHCWEGTGGGAVGGGPQREAKPQPRLTTDCTDCSDIENP